MGTVLLTGATGFVGRQVLRSLKERGRRVCLLTRGGKKHEIANLAASDEIFTTQDMFAESVDWFENVCNDIDTVVHVAWYTEPGKYLQSQNNIDCLIGTLRLAQGAIRAGVRRFVGIGTCFEYDLAQRELSVETSLLPLTPYAGAKAATFMALTGLLPTQGVEFVWCRLFYLFGEGEDSRRLVPYLRAKLEAQEPAELSSGSQIRDYLNVRMAGDLIVDTALNNSQGAVNICSGIPITIRQLAEQIAHEYGKPDLLKFGSRPDNKFDPPCVVGIK